MPVPTFSDYAPDYLQARSYELRPGSLANLRSSVNKWLLPSLGVLPLDEIRNKEVRVLLAQVAEGGGNVPGVYVHLTTLLNRAVDDEVIEVHRVKVKNATKRDDEGRPTFSVEQAYRVIEQMPASYHLFLQVLLGSAARVREGIGLQWRDFNPETGSLRIERQWINASYRLPKTGRAGCGTIFPMEVAVEALTARSARRSRYAEDADPMFTTVHHGVHFSYNRIQEAWEKARTAARVEEMHVHDLRAVSLTAYARGGATMQETMEFGRHRDVEIAMRYQHGADEAGRRKLARKASKKMAKAREN